MKNPNETQATADELPGFLNLEDDNTDSIGSAPMSSTTPNETTESLSLDDTAPADEAETTSLHETEPAPATTPAVTRERRTTLTPSRAGTASTFAGFGAIAAAIALATLPASDTVRATLSRFQLEPATVLLLGTVLAASGMNRRRLAALEQRLAIDAKANAKTGEPDEAIASLREGLQFLVESQHASNERPPAAGEELQHVLVALQRQDEKVNNLTKAIKMYGKPLMEISGQGTELAGSITQAKTAIEASTDATQKAFAQIQTQLRTNAGGHKEIADLTDIVLKVSHTVEALQKKPGTTVSLEPLQQQFGRLEVAIAAISQRIEDNELRKALLRLEDSTQKSREDVQHLLRGEGLQKATTQLQDRLDKATGRLSDGLTQMRENNLGGLESSVRELQREISGVATTVAQIQAVVKSGNRTAVAAAPAPAPVAPPTPAPAPAATETPAASNAPTATSAAKEKDGNSGYQTGTRSTGGKNVLGAIAKLKQMKN